MPLWVVTNISLALVVALENFENELQRRYAIRDRPQLKGSTRELFLLEPA